MKTALVTLGRLPKSLVICRALARSGWRVIVAEPSQRHLCGLSKYVAKSIRIPAPNNGQQAYHDALLAVADAENVSLIVPVSEEIMHASLIKPKLPEGVAMLCESHERLMQFHDKYQFNRLAQSFDLAVPPTQLLGSDEASDMASRTDVVLKPALTCSGQGLAFLSRGSALPMKSEADVLVQAALPGRHTSSFSIADRGRVLGTVVYRPEILTETVSCAFRRCEKASLELAWVETMIQQTKFNGMISFDFIADENGIPHAIECNPRVTSGIHFVEEKSLVRALVEPEKVKQLSFKRHDVMYQLWPTLTEVQGAMFRRGKGYGHKMKTMFSAKECNFEWTDPMPVWAQPYAAWEILRRAAVDGQSFGEAATHDIAWFG